MARRPLAYSLSCLSAAFVAGGCDSSSPLTPSPVTAPSLSLIVSDAARSDAAPAGALDGRVAANVGSNGAVAYVSAPSGVALGAGSAQITNLRLQQTHPATIIEGGFDPVPIPAQEGDSIEVRFDLAAGGALAARAAVPARRPPRVVRTHPARGRRDVAVNSVIAVVFSEPVHPATVGDSTVRLLRDGVAIRGTVRPSAGSNVGIEFAPAEPLDPATTYTFVLDARIRDLSGDPLEATEPVEFATFGEGGTAPLTVTTRTSGTDAPDGYDIMVDGRWAGHIGATDVLVLDDVGAGGHHVLLSGITDYCYAIGGLYRQATLRPGQGATLAYDITCTDRPQIELSVTTTGAELDSDGYHVVVNGMWAGGVPPNGNLSIDAARYGSNLLVLEGVQGNCTVAESARRAFDLASGQTDTLSFAVTCTASFTPSGTLAFSAYMPDGQTAIHVANADGSNRLQLTDGSAYDRSPAWSPDGRRLAFLRTDVDEGSTDLFIMNADGSGLVRRTAAFGEWILSPKWLPDGKRIVFAANGVESPYESTQSMMTGIFAVDADGEGPPSFLFPWAGAWGNYAWSADGSRLAYLWGSDVRIVGATGASIGAIELDAGVHSDPFWLSDGRTIGVVACRNLIVDLGECGMVELEFRSSTSGPARRAVPISQRIGRPVTSPDGLTLAFEDCMGCGPIRYMRLDGQGTTVEISDGFDPAWKP